jgi:YgiT-type zinc finger domain-containing protein
MACPSCGGEQSSSTRNARFELESVVVLVQVPTLVCSQCGRSSDEASGSEVVLAAARLASRIGHATGVTFKYLRTALRLPATRLAGWLNVRPETISRWENGQGTVDRSAWLILAAMVEDHFEGRTRTSERLQAAADPRIPSSPVTIGLDGLELPPGARTKGLAAKQAVRRSKARKRRRTSRSPSARPF